MKIRIGIVGVSGYGGSDLLHLCAAHPGFELPTSSVATNAALHRHLAFVSYA
jgi:N-acetyl-gamma-glutamylphosphate reductase